MAGCFFLFLFFGVEGGVDKPWSGCLFSAIIVCTELYCTKLSVCVNHTSVWIGLKTFDWLIELSLVCRDVVGFSLACVNHLKFEMNCLILALLCFCVFHCWGVYVHTSHICSLFWFWFCLSIITETSAELLVILFLHCCVFVFCVPLASFVALLLCYFLKCCVVWFDSQ